MAGVVLRRSDVGPLQVELPTAGPGPADPAFVRGGLSARASFVLGTGVGARIADVDLDRRLGNRNVPRPDRPWPVPAGPEASNGPRALTTGRTP